MLGLLEISRDQMWRYSALCPKLLEPETKSQQVVKCYVKLNLWTLKTETDEDNKTQNPLSILKSESLSENLRRNSFPWAKKVKPKSRIARCGAHDPAGQPCRL